MINPIFIVGAPRSGTSLLRVMLNRHPAIGISDELYYFYYVYNRRNKFGDLNDQKTRKMLVDRYLATERIRRLNLDLKSLNQTLLKEGDNYEKFYLALMQFYARSYGKNRYGEKTPQNAYFAEKLCDLYPDGRLIHIIRDPRAVVASLMKMPWASKSIIRNVRIWCSSIEQAKSCEHQESYLPVYYEKLVLQPETELKRICEFIDEEYFPGMLESGSETNIDKWWFRRAQEPLTLARIDTWKESLTGADVALIERFAGPQMQELGYQISGQLLSYRDMIAKFVVNGLTITKEKMFQIPRIWYFWLQPTQLAKEEALIDFRSK